MVKKFDLESFKKSLEMTELEEKKPLFLELNEELQACLGLPGLPMGDITEVYGDSDTGKSTVVFHAAAQAQHQDIFPVLIICEKKNRKARTKLMGFDPENAVINLGCKTIEDIFEFADKIIAKVNKGHLPYNTHIFVDSIGNVNCRAARIENKDGTTTVKNVHQQNAKALTEQLMLMSDKIGDTRFTASPHYIGMTIINHVYVEPAKFPGGMAINRPRGGKKMKYVSSLQIELKAAKNLSAIVDGNKIEFGFISKVRVKKNHVNGVKNTGEFVITEDEIFANEPGAINDYKDRHRDKWQGAEIIEEEGNE